MPRRSIRLAATGFAAVAACVAAAPASAGVLVQSAPGCQTPDSSTVFAPWADATNYFLAPDGGFEGGAAGWALSGASVADANATQAVSGPGDSALKVSTGDVATSPTVCIGIEHPTIRFFARRTAGPATATLKVDVLTEDTFGNVVAVPAASVPAPTSWQPSVQMVTASSLLPLLPGQHTPVAYRFTASGGTFQVDDFYVDPTGWKPKP